MRYLTPSPRYLIPRHLARAVDGSDAGAWVSRCQRTIPATHSAHPGQRWPTSDLLALLAGCGSKCCLYRSSREGIPHGLQLPGEMPMPPARSAITHARSRMHAPAFPCCRRADPTTFSASTSCPRWYAAVIPRSQQSLPPRRLTSRAMPQMKLAGYGSCSATRATARGS